jgi:hypothetical protein
MRKKWFVLGPIVIVLCAIIMVIAGGIVMWLWNWLLPPLFAIRPITFWQALGIMVLSRMLFGGFGVRGVARSRMRERMEERWGRMTPEEREAWRQRMRARWGFGPPAGESRGKNTGGL